MLRPRVQPDNKKKGVITRIWCRNFITYNEVEVCPGESLNIILGPNGTGKSTLVSAIVLGLGGKTKVIGRSDDLSQYIKMGHKKAQLKIEINNPDGRNIVIGRDFTKDNKSAWTLNGEKVPQKRIDKVVKECKIQVDNLCQFLPQDRVQDFAKMNMRELLEQTQRSIDNGELALQLDELKARRKEQLEYQKQFDALGQNLESEVQKNLNLEGEVRNAAERQNLVKKLETMKQKQAFLLYENKQRFLGSLVTRLNDKKREEEEIRNKQQYYETQITTAKRQVAQQEDTINQVTRAARTQVIELNTLLNTSNDISDKIEDEKNDLNNKLKTEEKREEEIKKINVHIERLMNDLPESDGSEQRQLQDISSQITATRNKQMQVQGADEDMSYNIRNKDNELLAIQGRIKQESNARNLKNDILRQRFPGLSKAVEWLRSNRDQFRGQVYDPMFTQLNVQEGYAKFVENAIPHRDLLAFTCEYASDTSKLIREFKTIQRLHGINIVTAPEDNGNGENAQTYFRPNIPLQQIKQYGFQEYLLNVITAPEPILRYLAKNMGLHNIPVGNATVNRNIDNIPATLRSYFSDDSRYRVSTSRYDSKKRLFSNSAIGNANLLRNNVNESRLKEYEAQAQILTSEREQLISQKTKLRAHLDALTAEVNTLNAQKTELRKKVDTQRLVQSKIEQKKRQRKELDESKIDPESAKQSFLASAKQMVEEFLQSKKRIIQVSNQIEHLTGEMKLHKLVMTGLKDTVRQKTEELKEYKKSINDTLEEIRQLEESVGDEKENCKRLLAKAVDLCKGVKPNSKAFEEYSNEFSKLPDDPEELESAVYETQARVDILAGTNNNNSLKEYEDRKKQIRNLEKDQEALQNRLDEIAVKMSSVRDKWYPKVKELINKIDKKFREFFDSFNCGGRVELYEGENENNYDEYGIRIMVRFRDNTELQALDSHTQSGGERAVSTAVYMLSLQELTDVPFRVVDEINQGMDSSNERRVFDLLVTTISATNSAQYFLLTPKLLEDLNYSEATTILNVHNGAFAMDYSLWDVQNFIEQRGLHQPKRRRRSDSYNDENQDTNTMR